MAPSPSGSSPLLSPEDSFMTIQITVQRALSLLANQRAGDDVIQRAHVAWDDIIQAAAAAAVVDAIIAGVRGVVSGEGSEAPVGVGGVPKGVATATAERVLALARACQRGALSCLTAAVPVSGQPEGLQRWLSAVAGGVCRGVGQVEAGVLQSGGVGGGVGVGSEEVEEALQQMLGVLVSDALVASPCGVVEGGGPTRVFAAVREFAAKRRRLVPGAQVQF